MLFSSARDIPDLQPILHETPTIDAEMRIESVHDYLLGRPDLLCLPVLDRKNLAGVIFSRDFIKRMSQQYVRELARKKTAADFMQSTFFHADVKEKITDVVIRLLQHDPRLKTDSIVVSETGAYRGVVPVSALMLALSDTQKQLIEQLDSLSQRLSDEVNITAQLQQQLMPQAPLRHGDWSVSGRAETSSEVGGDFYDYFSVGRRYLALAIGDASGHGVPAGMLVAAAKATLHSLPEEVLLKPDRVLKQLNRAILSTASSVRLMTFFYMVIDTEQHVARYSNAAHPFPYHLRHIDRALIAVEDAAGLPLGLDQDVDYLCRDMIFGGGDRMFFYTDGLVEEENANGDAFGFSRLGQSLRETREAHLRDVMEAIRHSLSRFTDNHQVRDDVTMMMLELAEATAAQDTPFAFCLLKASSETQRCTTEVLLRQMGLRITDGADQPEGVALYPVPIMTQHFYNAQLRFMPECRPGQHPILIAERPIRHQIGNMQANGIARALNLKEPILKQLELDHLLRGRSPERFISMPYLFQNVETRVVHHTEQKEALIAEISDAIDAGGMAATRPDLPGACALLLDEMLENAFLAVPERDRQRLGLVKGMARPLLEGERIELSYGYRDGLFGISVTDYWGSFEPSTLLRYFERHRYGGGMVAGEGGAGLYLLWRFADYLHVHVVPNEQTTFFVFFTGEGDIDPEVDKSFQLTVGSYEAH